MGLFDNMPFCAVWQSASLLQLVSFSVFPFPCLSLFLRVKLSSYPSLTWGSIGLITTVVSCCLDDLVLHSSQCRLCLLTWSKFQLMSLCVTALQSLLSIFQHLVEDPVFSACSLHQFWPLFVNISQWLI